ncbi:unnamed protein product [Meloidogyne enterolobii]|uniref:Uncharacterized protein n=1 Tax=Meloidogyne enterolobii TaxID=390850 RepID=A0ACB0YGM7_MELEN
MLKFVLFFLLLIPPLIASFDRTIDHFETNLDRFAKGPPSHIKPSRIILPTNFMEKLINNGGIQLKKQGNFERNFNENTNKLNNNHLNQPTTRILTNPKIPIDKILLNKNKEKEENAYLSQVNQLIPSIPSINTGEDPRPFLEGERLGQQGKFGGPTNQYKEDWGHKYTQKENREMVGQVQNFVSSFTSSQQSSKIEKDINPNLDGSKVFIDNNKKSLNTGLTTGRISPYLNAPEEITGSRWRSFDEYFNNLNKGNRGRGPNRFVKIDLLNE